MLLLLQLDYKSLNMEVLGLKRALKFLKHKVTIPEVVTDAFTTDISCVGIYMQCVHVHCVCVCVCVCICVQSPMLHIMDLQPLNSLSTTTVWISGTGQRR